MNRDLFEASNATLINRLIDHAYLRNNPSVNYTHDAEGRVIILDEDWRVHHHLSTVGVKR